MTFLTPIILGVLIIAAATGVTFIGLSVYDIFIRKDFPDYTRTALRDGVYNIFKVSVILAIILSVLELYV